MTTVARFILVLALSMVWASRASGQGVYGPMPQSASTSSLPLSSDAGGMDGINPVGLLESAGNALPGGGGLSGAMNVLVLLTVLSLAPAIMIMCTSFVRIVVVLALLKQALGTQTLPPSQVIVGLALFMTFVVMGPTIDRVYTDAIGPYQRGEVASQIEMWDRAKGPIRDFMFDQIETTGNWSSLYMMLEARGVDVSEPSRLTRADVDTMALIPAYMLSELKTAFLMGFRVYLPFLVIDMVIASLLISMSMMMLPPVLVSLPFKILLFVLVDGWDLVVGSLMRSFVVRGEGSADAVIRSAVQAMGGG